MDEDGDDGDDEDDEDDEDEVRVPFLIDDPGTGLQVALEAPRPGDGASCLSQPIGVDLARLLRHHVSQQGQGQGPGPGRGPSQDTGSA